MADAAAASGRVAGLEIALDVLRLGRIHFLGAGFALFTVGALVATASGAPFSAGRFLAGYLVMATGHLSISYSNDYFDYEADLGAKTGSFSGGSGVLRRRPELRGFARAFALALIGASLLLGVAFAFAYQMPPYYMGLVAFGNLLGWFYTAPPLRLAYRGLGEAATVAGIGFLVPAAGCLALAGTLPPLFFAFTVPMLIYAGFFILGVEAPDAGPDRAAGKMTLVARLGRPFAYAASAVLDLAATLAYLALAGALAPIGVWPLVVFSLAPVAAAVYGLLRPPSSPEALDRQAGLSIGSLIVVVSLTDLYLAYIQLA